MSEKPAMTKLSLSCPTSLISELDEHKGHKTFVGPTGIQITRWVSRTDLIITAIARLLEETRKGH